MTRWGIIGAGAIARTGRAALRSAVRVTRRFATRAAAVFVAALAVVAAALLLGAAGPGSLPPRYEHIVIVIEENHSAAQVMESPYLSSLAARGTFFSAMYGITHPSQPNYVALFSGSTQGVKDDGVHDLHAPNLATSLAAAGLSFATYSEGLPSEGSRVASRGRYVRKHNPAASFTNVPGSSNLPLQSFPADFSRLPTVSFVIPDLAHDMHDGSVAQGDEWLKENLDGYARWAPANASLLVLTFDECAGRDPVDSTPIATILVGASVRPGVSAQRVTLYSLLRMIEEIYGLPTLAEEGTAPRITGVWD